MTRRQLVTIEVTDDLDGSKAAETVAFSYDGQSYEIDLNKRNTSALRKILAPYIDAARSTRSQPKAVRRKSTPDPKVVRAWALENGVEVPRRGRVPLSVVAAYQAGMTRPPVALR
jgi:hypothetical protein